MKKVSGNIQLFLVGLLAITLTGGILVASNANIASMNNVVVCVNKKTGTMRLPIKDKCKKREQRIVLAQTGPQGPQGPQGLQGLQGPAGPVTASGNYLNELFGYYDSNGKNTEFEILSLDGFSSTVRFKDFLFRMQGIQEITTWDQQFFTFLYGDSRCKTPASSFHGFASSNESPMVMFGATNLIFFTTEARKLKLNSWDSLSKYGRLYVKVSETSIFRRKNYSRNYISQILNLSHPELNDDERNAIVEKFNPTFPSVVSHLRKGECIDLQSYLAQATDYGIEMAYKDAYWYLVSETNRGYNYLPGIDLDYLLGTNNIDRVSNIFDWSEISAYWSTWDPTTAKIVNFNAAADNFSMNYLNKRNYEIKLWRNFTTNFEYPLTLRSRK